MEANKIKNILIQRIQAINDEAFLNALKVLTDAKVENDKYKLSPFEQEKIKKAREQHANGETFSQEEVQRDVDSWLKSA
ncbi:hypothetical protein DXT99_13120 [Pontibacter diazotrophicus]|uniref:Uncharacterized protein n=1 Tax=Pontibacter diazotrophicus TaxID=1400979 RepID=A0A3D8LB10_9BACT|nr:hypothetical protein [Pontibacter diazotrophicus]RDV14609.1 hypothetical protein DXT99_13120 [Pontibacter diazotrophicus]